MQIILMSLPCRGRVCFVKISNSLFSSGSVYIYLNSREKFTRNEMIAPAIVRVSNSKLQEKRNKFDAMRFASTPFANYH